MQKNNIIHLFVIATIALLSVCTGNVYATTPQDTIRVLAIGNSFSEDAVENYLYDLAKTDSVVMIIGNMYIGGCSLATHWQNAQNNSNAYSYRKIAASGVKTTRADVSLQTAITEEPWDYISLQQFSGESGIYASYFPALDNLKGYVRTLATNANMQFLLHLTWAYAQNSTHSSFVNYNNDQMTMYNAIVSAVYNASETSGISKIIPSGTAIQNGRTSSIGDNFCRDGYHLDLGFGRFTAACTWYEILTGKKAVDNTYVPSNITVYQSKVAKMAASYAIEKPKVVTQINQK